MPPFRSIPLPLPLLFRRALSTYPPSPARPFTFHVAASWAGKPRAPRKANTPDTDFPVDHPVRQWRDAQLARREKLGDAGEDFWLVEQMKDASGVALGVADGVGGWADSNIDPSLFSQSLMHSAAAAARGRWAGEPDLDPLTSTAEVEETGSPQLLLEEGYDGVLRDRHVKAGSSTACILTLDAKTGDLAASNLGDSSFALIRSGKIVLSAPSQTHFFNCPRQLAKLGPMEESQGAITDLPRHADRYKERLRDGDVLVVFTDGFGDNVHEGELLELIRLAMKETSSQPESSQVRTVADVLVGYARMCMAREDKVSPFQIAAKKEKLLYRGGKVDDVTVIVALVQEN